MINLEKLRFQYFPSFRLLVDDFEELLTYVEPVDANLKTYSHRIYELLLRACTEFESLAKEALIETGYHKKPEQMKIYDYRHLEQHLKLGNFEIGLLIWRPQPVFIQPYKDWDTNSPPLTWYSAYNAVKHNRNTEFHNASLENLRLAISAVYMLHKRTKLIGITRDRIHPYSMFSIRVKE